MTRIILILMMAGVLAATMQGTAAGQVPGLWTTNSSQPDLVSGTVPTSVSGAVALTVDSKAAISQYVTVTKLDNATLTVAPAGAVLVPKGGMQLQARSRDVAAASVVEVTVSRNVESVAFDLAIMGLKAVVSVLPGGNCLSNAIVPNLIVGTQFGLTLSDAFVLVAEAAIRNDPVAVGKHTDAALRQIITYLSSRATDLGVNCAAEVIAQLIANAFPASAVITNGLKIARIVVGMAPTVVGYIQSYLAYGTDAAKVTFSYAPSMSVSPTATPSATRVPPTSTAISSKVSPTPTPTFTRTVTPTPTSTGVPPTPTPTPTRATTPTPTATPTTRPGPPAAPSDVQLGEVNCFTDPCPGTTLVWSDNSNNELGFHLYWSYVGFNCEERLEHARSVAANTTQASLEPLFFLAVVIECGDGRRYGQSRAGVSAYNAHGESRIVWAR